VKNRKKLRVVDGNYASIKDEDDRNIANSVFPEVCHDIVEAYNDYFRIVNELEDLARFYRDMPIDTPAHAFHSEIEIILKRTPGRTDYDKILARLLNDMSRVRPEDMPEVGRKLGEMIAKMIEQGIKRR